MMPGTYKPEEPKRIYLACPYWHDDENVREDRFQLVTEKAAQLMQLGYRVFSPITHSHPISKYMSRQDHNFWMAQDFPYIEYWADEVWIYTLDGWRESRGVGLEIDFAFGLDMEIRLIK